MTLIDRSFSEKILLVGVGSPGLCLDEVDYSLDELTLLVETAGAKAVGRLIQRRERPDPGYYLGKGKLAELVRMSYELDVDTVVFDDNLTPAQTRNLTAKLGRTAIDRTAVILDIFAQNATSLEGKAQVELALLKYRLPHLRGKGTSLSQQAGGIGTRGPGETKLETDRRRLVQRIVKLERELEELGKTRTTQRRSRRRGPADMVSIVGYTNAGKSSILNVVTNAGVQTDSRLFATLDPRVRKRYLPSGNEVLISDTVGFVSKLPHQLVQAFHSTLEVIAESNLLVHLVDGSDMNYSAKIDSVDRVLAEIGSHEIDQVLVFNKIDRISLEEREKLRDNFPKSILVSARSGEGIADMIKIIDNILREGSLGGRVTTS